MSDDIGTARILQRAADENFKAAIRMQGAAELIARAVECQCDLLGMAAENLEQARLGKQMAYPDTAFFALAEDHRITEEHRRDLLGPARGSQREDLPGEGEVAWTN